jgi:hypothetical protein
VVELGAAALVVVYAPAVEEEAGVLPRHANGHGLPRHGPLQEGLIVGAENAVGLDGFAGVMR